MTSHFKRSLGVIGVVCVLLAGVFLWLKHKTDTIVKLPSLPVHTGLRPDERELISFNEKTHRVTITTSSNTVKMYARNPTIRVKNDGKITVDRHLIGFEARPFIGVGYSDTTRALLGFAPFYWGAFDASVAVGVSLDKQYVFAKPYAAVGYNCWSNLSINAGVNPAAVQQLDVILFMSVKL